MWMVSVNQASGFGRSGPVRFIGSSSEEHSEASFSAFPAVAPGVLLQAPQLLQNVVHKSVQVWGLSADAEAAWAIVKEARAVTEAVVQQPENAMLM